MRAEDARLGGKERGRASSQGEHVRELWITDLTPAERARFLRGYEKLFRDAELYYRRRPQPGGHTAHAPLGGVHHASIARGAGLLSITGGTAGYTGDAAAVRAAADAYEASGYEVVRGDGTQVVVTWYDVADGRRQATFTTTLSVRSKPPQRPEAGHD